MPPEKIPLSVAIITKNEERNLPSCLQSVSFAADVVVVDSGSTDRTVGIAREFGCRVFIEPWKGYGPQKNSAVEKCINDWVLIVDADERIPEDTADAIAGIISKPPGAEAFSFKRRNYLHGRWIRRCGWWPDRVVRLVRKKRGCFHSLTHERWITNGTTTDLDASIDHYSFSGYEEMLQVMETRSTHMARELFDSGKKVTALTPFIHGFAMFLGVYFLRGGFLEGLDGFVIALTRAGGSFFKYAKLLELQQKEE